jgi:hydroxymethylbilane synthase
MVSVNLDRHEILVVGGGEVAERKARTLIRSGARVRLVSPDATWVIEDMAGEGDVTWECREVVREDFERHDFAVVAVRDADADAIAAMARGAGCLVDVCSDGAKGDFALCAQFETDGCYVGVSSGGRDPSRAALLKRDIMAAGRTKPVRLLTRNSPLAIAQSEMWIEAMSAVGVSAVLRAVTSHGDRDRTSDLSSFGFGAFVKALEDDLLNGVGDCAVHSLKDMPSTLPGDCVIAAVLPRGAVHDLLVTRDGTPLDSLPPGGRVGTSSVRRRAQILSVRPDLECVSCRGNIDTRLFKLKNGEVDALVLAEAGLNRLGKALDFAERLPFVTSAGQGAIAAEVRAGSPLEGVLRLFNHVPTWYEVTAERAFLAHMGLGCVCPIGVRGEYAGGTLELTADVFPFERSEDSDGGRITARIRGKAGSEEEARLIASRLWDEVCDKPLMRSLSSSRGEARP